MRKDKTTSTFNKGLIMDLNPLTTPNDVITDALNATLITYNGNEYALQNDMGNGRVETAYLPEGYIPLGTAELGGIIYIVSYNPLIKKCQIGSFPSPERIFLSSELQQAVGKNINLKDFYKTTDSKSIDYLRITSPYIKLVLLDKVLNPGDKFIINCSDIKEESEDPLSNPKILSAYNNSEQNSNLDPRYLKLKVVAIQDNGTVTDLTNQLIWYDKYYINDSIVSDSEPLDIDEYRNLVSSNYNVFSSKVSGKLAIIAQLECINTFDVAWNALKNSNGKWNIYLLLNWTYENEEDRNKINLYGVYCNPHSEENYEGVILPYPYQIDEKTPTGTTDILERGQDSVFLNPIVSESNFGKISLDGNNLVINYNNSTSPRLNDGTDNQFILSTPVYTQKENETDNKLTLEVFPMMPFGILDWLKQTFTIDLSLLGSGEIKLERYKYYVEEDIITLNYGISAYPELNKEISSVQFNFYSINDLVDQINGEGINIDNVRYIKDQEGVTHESTSSDVILQKAIKPNLESLTPAYSFPLENQSSYSGNFTKIINKEEFKEPISPAYLVEIAINYNNSEKIYYYYRIMYTTDIFNSEYNNQNDFGNIVLNDILNKNSFISVENVRTNSLRNIIDEYPNQIPSYYDTQYQTSSDYHIQIDTSVNFSFDLKYNLSVGEGTFDIPITCSIINSPDIKISCEGNLQSNNNYLEELDEPSISSETGKSIESNSNTVTVNVEQMQVNVPIYLSYDTPITVDVPYELVKSNCKYVWFAIGGYDHECKIYLYDSWKGNILCSSGPGDDDDWDQQFSDYVEVYTYLQKMLDEADILIIPIITYQSGRKGEEFTICQFHTRGNWTFELQGTEEGQGANRCVSVFYAMKRTNGDILLFTFDNSFTTNTYGCLFGNSDLALNYTTSAVYNVDNGDRYIYTPTTVLWTPLQSYLKEYSTNSNVTTGPYWYFNKYHKVVQINSTKIVYQLTTVNYYNSIINMITIPQETINYSKKLKIGDQILNPGLGINNLYYEASGTFNRDYVYENTVSLQHIIDRITSINANLQFIKINDQYKQASINPKAIYDENLNSISFLKLLNKVAVTVEDASTDLEREQFIEQQWQESLNSKIMIVTDDGHIRVSSDYTEGVYDFYGKNEEQSIWIRNAAKRLHNTDGT